ncbi:NnrS family protein [Ectothiorhodospira lacustris]|uniref:NnrS family protein n=1 Tax=Ectothiorhodospira lacustris TaxID=2899127 RepID=UPI001EE7B369|nr:NnrS family protein [Ectothiorhodospira lacustris]MCG5499773.1 NnrS family protein [Ectothiorhodospira lacustris]
MPTFMKQTWHHYSAAPHRLMFLPGMIQLVLTVIYWGIELAGRYTTWWSPLTLNVPGFALHPFLMLYGIFPFFMFGFLMTTYPRWMNGNEIPRSRYVPAWAALTGGMALFYLGLFTQGAWVTIGIVLYLAGWAWAMAALWAVYLRAPATDRTYETWLNAALMLGWLGAASWLVWRLEGSQFWYAFSLQSGFWLFLIPVLVIVGHRMIPFFSNFVLKPYTMVQPRWSLPLMAIAVVGHVILTLTGHWQWRFIPDFALAFLALHHAWHWGFRRALDHRLLAVLHIAWAWLAVGMLFFGVQSLILMLTGQWWFGHSPQHALALGFITSMTLGMATRVTLGHSGRALQVNGFTWACFLALSGATLTRVTADLPWLPSGAIGPMNLASALIWLAFITPWALYYGPMLWRPRVDGRPG